MAPEKPVTLTQKEAAAMLHVSVSYLRASDCPKILLPPNRGKRPTVRYDLGDVKAWREKWTVRSTIRMRRTA